MEFERLAHLGIQVINVFVVRQTLAVRRVDHNQGAFGGGCIGHTLQVKLLEADLTHLDEVLHTRTLDILERRLHGVVARIGTVNLVGKDALVGIVVVDGLEQVFIKIGPFLERKLLAEDARSNVLGNERRLN